jgi:hypothetical protein
MKNKNLIQYRSRSGITSYGSKIEDMSCYKAGTSCWMDKKANISAQLKEISKQCQTPPKDRSGQGKSLPEV